MIHTFRNHPLTLLIENRSKRNACGVSLALTRFSFGMEPVKSRKLASLSGNATNVCHEHERRKR